MKTKRFDISFIAPLFLFAFFSICVMSVLIMGADLYRKQTQRDLVGYNHRTVSQYISTRIHQSDKHNSFFVSDFNTQTPQSKGNAFFFTEIINGSEYYTCIYSHDGYLYELFAAKEDSLDITAGERILEVQSVEFIDNGKNITVNVTHLDDSVQTIVINLRCSGEKTS